MLSEKVNGRGDGGGGGSGGSARETLPVVHDARTFLSFVFDFYYLLDTLDAPRARMCACACACAFAFARIDASTNGFPAVVHPNIMNK